METVYNKENLQAHLESIKPIGYMLQSYNEDNSFYFIKNEGNKTIRIILHYDEYFPHGVHFSGCSISVAFIEIEQIYNDVLANHLDTGYGHGMEDSYTFDESFHNAISDEDMEYIYSIQVSDNTTFNQVKPFLQQMLNAALQFLNQYVSLQDFYTLGESMSIDDMSYFYCQPLPPRRLIVKKLVNASDYNTYATGLIDRYFNQYNKPIIANFLQGLKNYLDANY